MDNQAILDNLKSGGQEILGEIYEAYREEFIVWIMKGYSVQSDDAKDIYQASIMALSDNVKMGKLVTLKSSVKTYLFSIGKYKAMELHKKASRFNSDSELENLEYAPPDHDVLEEQERLAKLVNTCLDKLGDPCKSLLKKYYYEKKSMVDIAEILNYKNARTTKNLKYKCILRLRKIFQSEGVKVNQ